MSDMNEPIYVPILLDVDTLDAEELDVVYDGEEIDVDIENPIIIGGGGNLPIGGVEGDIIVKRSSKNYDAAWVAPASDVEEDNTLPITSAAVYREVGNINALLATI